MNKVLTVILPWLTRRLLAGVTAVGVIIGAPPEANQQVTAFITAGLVFLVECLQKWVLLKWKQYRSRQTAALPFAEVSAEATRRHLEHRERQAAGLPPQG